jgi:hypothetical protein
LDRQIGGRLAFKDPSRVNPEQVKGSHEACWYRGCWSLHADREAIAFDVGSWDL